MGECDGGDEEESGVGEGDEARRCAEFVEDGGVGEDGVQKSVVTKGEHKTGEGDACAEEGEGAFAGVEFGDAQDYEEDEGEGGGTEVRGVPGFVAFEGGEYAAVKEVGVDELEEVEGVEGDGEVESGLGRGAVGVLEAFPEGDELDCTEENGEDFRCAEVEEGDDTSTEVEEHDRVGPFDEPGEQDGLGHGEEDLRGAEEE